MTRRLVGPLIVTLALILALRAAAIDHPHLSSWPTHAVPQGTPLGHQHQLP